jgi:prepilin-type N-terminal cleavage/methylation domain-containing protein
MSRLKHGFTLIELLAVLAIVFVLCALVFAAMGPAREKSRQAACASNLHQWGTAFAMYIADYDGIEPQIGTPLKASQLGLPPLSDVTGFMRQYNILNTPLMTCPSAHYPDRSGRYGPKYVSYELQGFEGDDSLPGFDRMAAARGPNITLMRCQMHNVDINFERQPTWATKWVQWLTIDQHIQFKQMQVNEYP